MFKNAITCSFAEWDCITISSDSEVENNGVKIEQKDHIDNHNVTSYCNDDHRCDVIDAIVDQWSHTLKKKKRLKKKIKKIAKKEENKETSAIIRDEKKRSLGLRQCVKPVDHYRSPVEEKKRKVQGSTNDDDDESNNENDTISYLLANTTQAQDDHKSKDPPMGVCVEGPSDDESSSSSDETTDEVHERETKLVNLHRARNGDLKLDDVCLSCGTEEGVAHLHPLFEGGLCRQHYTMFTEWHFKYDADGSRAYCSICCMGDHVVICDQSDCGRCFCSSCLNLLVGPGTYDVIMSTDGWECYVCDDRPASMLRRREDWKIRIRDLLTVSDAPSKYLPLPVPSPLPRDERRPIRILSLFDGIATGIVAAKQLGLKIGKFVASEIDEAAIRLVQNRHPEVIHVGDITKLSDEDVRRHGPFDLVMGGSPCNDLSGANPKRRGLLDGEGTGCLFFDFFRVLKAATPEICHRCDDVTKRPPFFWLFENVVSMKMVDRRRITRFLECEPVLVDARHVSAAARPRLFWGNLPYMKQLNVTPCPGDRLDVQSCLEPGRNATVVKLNTITTKPGCLYQGSTRQAPVTHMGKEDVLWSTEVERIFGVPEHYTDVNNLGPRERLALLGRSWSVPVVKQILAPLKQYYVSNDDR